MTLLRADFKIIRATVADVELSRRAIQKTMASTTEREARFSEAALNSFLESQANYLLIAMVDAEPVGALYGYALPHPTRPEPQFFLYAIDVLIENSNQGIGTALVNEFIRMAKDAGAWEAWVITSESNRAAFTMYTRAGMMRCADDDVVLVIDLKSVSEGELRS